MPTSKSKNKLSKKHLKKNKHSDYKSVLLRFLSTLLLLLWITLPPLHSRERRFVQSSSNYFQFIFQEDDVEAVGELLSFADETFEQLSQLFGYQLQRKISVVIGGESAFANGSYSPVPPLLTLLTASSATRSIGARNVNYLKTLFVHELSHYLHLNTPVGVSHWATKLFGPAATVINTPFLPGWWTEGVALYSESHYSQGGRRDDLHLALKYQAPLLTHESWSLSQGAYQGPKEPSGRIYSTGQVMLEHLVTTYGEEKIAAITASFQKFPFFGLAFAFKRELGKSPKGLYQSALAELTRSLANITLQEEPFSPTDEASYYLPYKTANGYLGFAQNPLYGSAIVRYDDLTENVNLVKRVQLSDVLSFDTTSDGNTWLLAHHWTDPLDQSWPPVSYSDLFLYQVDENSYHRLTHGQRLFQGAISADGTNAVAIEQVGSRFRLVQVLPIERPLFDQNEISIYEPRFNQAGDALVAVAMRAGCNALILINLDGTFRYLTPFFELALYRPRFSTSGDILFSADYEGTLSLMQLEIDSGTMSLILQDRVGIIGALEAEGELIYQSYRSNGHLLLKTPISNLEHEVVLLPSSEAKREEREIPSFVSSTYRDALRFAIWAPLPYVQEQACTLGATFFWSSPLARHTLLLSPYWIVHQDYPTFLAHYLFSGHRVDLQLSTTLQKPYFDALMATERPGHSFEAKLALPLAYQSNPSRSLLWQGGVAANLVNVPQLNTVTSLAIQSSGHLWSPSSKRNYFGSNALSALIGAQLLHWQKSDQWEVLLSSQVAFQLDLGHSGNLLAVSAESLFTSGLNLGQQTLPAFGNPNWTYPTGKGKTRLTLMWGLPALLPDWPLLTGGITRLAALFFAQSALYLRDMSIEWERELYFGSELYADFTFHSALALQLSAGVVARASDLAWHFYITLELPLAFARGSQTTLIQRAEPSFRTVL